MRNFEDYKMMVNQVANVDIKTSGSESRPKKVELTHAFKKT